MCGKEASLILLEVEGVELKACPSCTRFGSVKQNSEKNWGKESPNFLQGINHPVNQSPRNEEPELKLVDNYSSLIRSEREKRGMKQEDFAKFLNERESIVSKWEQGTLKPGVDTAKKLEKQLGINLIEILDYAGSEKLANPKEKKDVFTLGDFIRIRKRK